MAQADPSTNFNGACDDGEVCLYKTNASRGTSLRVASTGAEGIVDALPGSWKAPSGGVENAEENLVPLKWWGSASRGGTEAEGGDSVNDSVSGIENRTNRWVCLYENAGWDDLGFDPGVAQRVLVVPPQSRVPDLSKVKRGKSGTWNDIASSIYLTPSRRDLNAKIRDIDRILYACPIGRDVVDWPRTGLAYTYGENLTAVVGAKKVQEAIESPLCLCKE